MFALSEFDIRYQLAKAVKGQALADLVADRISTDIAALFIRAWAMFFDGSACDDGCGVGIGSCMRFTREHAVLINRLIR